MKAELYKGNYIKGAHRPDSLTMYAIKSVFKFFAKVELNLKTDEPIILNLHSGKKTTYKPNN